MSTDQLIVVPVVLPLLGAALSMVVHGHRWLQRVIGAAVLSLVLAAAIALLVEVHQQGVVALHVGAWPAPIGITLVADLFSAIMVVVSAATLLAVFVYAIGQPRTDSLSHWFHPVYLTLAAGVALAFLTGDLFNLFVAFEIMLMSSYVLITLGGSRDQIRSGTTYVVIGLLASTLFISAVGLVYAATGTVDMADLSMRLEDVPVEVRAALGALLLVTFGVKAAIFPLFFWLPDSYPTARTPITAIFAGLLTKVGVYAIVRTQTLLFPADEPSLLLLTLAGATMLVGVLGAIAQGDMKRILSFHIISQIGYMIMGVGLFTVAGVAATIFFIVHQIVVKTSLFLVNGLVEFHGGTANLRRLGGWAHRKPFLAVLFLLSALSLAGLPPFSGFVGKLGLIEAGTDEARWVIVAVSLLASLLTLFSMTKIWAGVFWGAAEDPVAGGAGDAPSPPLMLGATAALVTASIVIALAAGPIYDLAEQAAAGLLDPTAYRTAVLGS